MSLNFEPFNPTFNDLAIKLAIILFMPLIIAWIIKVLLTQFMKESIASRLASLSFLFFVYYAFKFVVEWKGAF